MSAFDRLVTVATGAGDVMALARRIIGDERLALAIAKLALAETTLTVSPKDVATVLEIDRSTASRHIDAIGIKNHDAA